IERSVPGLSDRLFFTGMGLASMLTVLIGFVPRYFLRSEPPTLNSLYLLHGLLFAAWVLFFIGQTALVAGHRTDIHRRLGYVGAALATAVLVVGLAVALDTLRGGFGEGLLSPRTRALIDPRVFLAIPIGDIAPFAVFVALAVLLRRHS